MGTPRQPKSRTASETTRRPLLSGVFTSHPLTLLPWWWVPPEEAHPARDFYKKTPEAANRVGELPEELYLGVDPPTPSTCSRQTAESIQAPTPTKVLWGGDWFCTVELLYHPGRALALCGQTTVRSSEMPSLWAANHRSAWFSMSPLSRTSISGQHSTRLSPPQRRLEKTLMSWDWDENTHRTMEFSKFSLPSEAFYPRHVGSIHPRLCSQQDLGVPPWVPEFKFQLCTRCPNLAAVRPYYQGLTGQSCTAALSC
ncbi:inositol oxygenase-like [Lepus europaeus]|uniref:inositol oxygenase-like n=1 Tax=Lepus europaeus TaxID=9983 RepID=UPI002B4AA802|nr:inositol oxygenase-like [Lepus europaeus]